MFDKISPAFGSLGHCLGATEHKGVQTGTSPIIPESDDINQSNEGSSAALCIDLSAIKTFLKSRSDDMYFSHIKFLNFYLPAAIKSRTKDLSPKLSYKQKQRLCLCYVISTYIRSFNKTCYASKVSLINAYNSNYAAFGLTRGIKKSTFDSILKDCYSLGLVSNVSRVMGAEIPHFRRLVVNFDAFKAEYPCAYNLASSNAKRKVNGINLATYQKIMAVDNSGKSKVKTGIIKKITSKLGLGRSTSKNPNLSIDNIELVDSEFLKVEYIREKNTSKEVRNKILKRSTGNVFDYSCFNQDSKLAEELQAKARLKNASNKDLSDLLCLHVMHNVKISKAWHKFLRRLAYANQAKSDIEDKAGDIFLKAFPLAI